MNNLNNATETATTMGHNLVDEFHHLGHEFINNALGISIPIINSLANVDINIPRKLDTINYYIRDINNTILVICELPGASKNSCIVNYTNGILKVSGHTMYNNECENICDKKYYREINVGGILTSNINVEWVNGVLKIKLLKHENDVESTNIEIN